MTECVVKIEFIPQGHTYQECFLAGCKDHKELVVVADFVQVPRIGESVILGEEWLPAKVMDVWHTAGNKMPYVLCMDYLEVRDDDDPDNWDPDGEAWRQARPEER